MKQIHTKNYNIELGGLVHSSFYKLLKNTYKDSKKIILVDENSHEYCLEYLLTNFEELKEAEIMLLPVGEENKVLEVCFQVWEALSEYIIGRKDVIINLGGGVVTDMGGFIASIYKRGIDFIHIPTTLLAMVDASVGGKTGIDLGPYKNQLGTFSDPRAVFIDLSFLETLPQEEILNGYAEMLKHALILDPFYWEELIQIASFEDLMSLDFVEKSIRLKTEVVEADPFESDGRKKLNFGHTVGHALEGYFLDKDPLSHGHAVGIGLLAESFLSYRKGLLSEVEWQQIQRYLTSIFPLLEFSQDEIVPIMELMKNDKKNYGNEIKCCLLRKIGECEVDHTITEPEIREVLSYLLAIQGS
jgi:3-dehydroquinate synthase